MHASKCSYLFDCIESITEKQHLEDIRSICKPEIVHRNNCILIHTHTGRERQSVSIANIQMGVEKWVKYWNLTLCKIRLIVWQNDGKLNRPSHWRITDLQCLWKNFLLFLAWLTLMQGDCVGILSYIRLFNIYYWDACFLFVTACVCKCAHLNSFSIFFFFFAFHPWCNPNVLSLYTDRTVIDFQTVTATLTLT